MGALQPAVVGLTDDAWFRHFRPDDARVDVDEVNFWRPLAQTQFRALEPGQPFFLRLKAPDYAIAGFGFFAHQTRLSVSEAWTAFGTKNGDPTFERFAGRIQSYRRANGRDWHGPTKEQLTCLVLRDVVFFPSSLWLPWDEREGWGRSTQGYKTYDLAKGPGELLAELLRVAQAATVPELGAEFTPFADDTRGAQLGVNPRREGQGTFRVRLLDAYERRCAVTGEHALPVLDAAHIQPYLGPASNHVQNGLVLRTDLHRLFDDGYVSISPDLELMVSRRLREEFDNGEAYYAMAGRQLLVPRERQARPSRSALEWHASNVFR